MSKIVKIIKKVYKGISSQTFKAHFQQHLRETTNKRHNETLSEYLCTTHVTIDTINYNRTTTETITSNNNYQRN